jgi:hypothetical protein
MIRTRALIYETDGKTRAYVHSGRPDRVDDEYAFLKKWFPECSPRLVDVEIREVVEAPVAFCAHEEET